MKAGSDSRQLSDDERRLTLFGVLLVFLLSALDNTIVSTAVPKIVSQLGGLNLYAWVTTAYLLTSTVTVPIYGKLGDTYGRKPVLVSGVAVFVIGSALCGLAGEFGRLPVLGAGMTQLIVFRGVQGLGGGALFTSAFAIIADLYPPRERAKFAGLFGSIFGFASIVGPVIGGFLADIEMTRIGGFAVAGWRWIFYVNLPVSALALFFIVVKMPGTSGRTPGRIDFAGAALLILTFVPLLLALGGDDGGAGGAPGGRPLLYAVSAIGLVAFLITEVKVANPVVSLDLFRNRVFSTTNAVNFSVNMAFMGTVTFVPLLLQLGQGVDAATSGLSILPMMIGMIGVSTACGRAITRTGRYKPMMVAGMGLLVVAMLLLSRVAAHTSTLDLACRMLLLGVALGPSLSVFNVIIQNAVPRDQIGAATSATQFFRQIGGTVGVAVFGALVTHNLAVSAARLPPVPGRTAAALTVADLQRLAAAGQHGTAPAFGQGARDLVVGAIADATLMGVALAVLAFVVMLFVPALPLGQQSATAAIPAGVEGAAEGLARG